jgi:hypothetical protein
MSKEQISGWKAIPFRVATLYFACCGMADTAPTWDGLREFTDGLRQKEVNVA